MDLTNFSSEKKKQKKQLILNNNEITIYQIDDKYTIKLKSKQALKKYQNFLFFSPTNSEIIEDIEEAKKFFELSLSEGVEGLMFKKLDSPYKPGLRTGAMAKLKQTKEDIDVVIVGAEHGTGKRAGYYSSFLVAVKNENDEFFNIGKVSSGIKELEDSTEGISMQKITELLKPLKISEDKNMTYFEPKIIIQVRYQEIQKSTIYDSGYALRFPRIIMLRQDKILEEINSIEDIEKFIL